MISECTNSNFVVFLTVACRKRQWQITSSKLPKKTDGHNLVEEQKFCLLIQGLPNTPKGGILQAESLPLRQPALK